MSKHTPGPWSVDPRAGLRIRSATDNTIASCGCTDSERESWEANARLIAAAPELLEALQALRLAHKQDKYPSWEKGVPNFNKAEALADAAIDKAMQKETP